MIAPRRVQSFLLPEPIPECASHPVLAHHDCNHYYESAVVLLDDVDNAVVALVLVPA